MSKKKKTVNISDVNKEIAKEMKEEKFKGDIVRSLCKLDKSVGSLLNITSMLEKKFDDMQSEINRLKHRMGL